jgi:hypothetical protein
VAVGGGKYLHVIVCAFLHIHQVYGALHCEFPQAVRLSEAGAYQLAGTSNQILPCSLLYSGYLALKDVDWATLDVMVYSQPPASAAPLALAPAALRAALTRYASA